MEAVLQGPSSRTVLGPTVLTIGRTTDNQLVVNDPKASSHHAEMRPSGQGYSIIDVGSTNGTFVNDQRLDRNIPRPLATGDRVRIGDTLFTYIVTGVAPGAYGSPGQASYSEYTPTIAAPPAGSYEYTGYGQGAQQYPPPAAYSPPQPYESPQQQYAPPPPAYPPYAQPYAPPGVPVPPYVPPPTPTPVAPIPPPTARKARAGSRVLLIVLAILVVLAAGGGFLVYHFLTLPQPVIQVSSKYQVGSTPAGSTSTSFHVSAQKFPANSTITFLLDGTPIPGSANAQSDANGNVQADLTVTSAWSVGNHTLTAKDANNDTTRLGASVVIAPPGEAGTPGPNGAPPDNMKFSLNISIQPKDVTTGKTLSSFTQTLVITGQPDPAGGTVCRQPFSSGQQLTLDGTLNKGAISYHETYMQTCSGTYKGGNLSYTETITSDQYALPGGVTCTVKMPYASERLTGAFTTSTAISGTYSSDKISAPCSDNTIVTFNALSGSWTGQSS